MTASLTAAILPVVLAFVLTGVLGTILTTYLQRRSWQHQFEVTSREQRRAQAFSAFDEISPLLDRRLYRMRMVHWSLRSGAAFDTQTGAAELDAARQDYRTALREWNDALNRSLALVQVHFGTAMRVELEAIQEQFTELGRALDSLLRARLAGDITAAPDLSGRFSALAGRIYAFNVRLLTVVDSSNKVSTHVKDAQSDRDRPPPPQEQQAPRTLALGMIGADVRTLQRSLQSVEPTLEVDGIFGWETYLMVRRAQAAGGTAVDGLVGPATWRVLSAAPSEGPPD